MNENLTRRGFFAGSFASACLPALASVQTARSADVIVAGGGPAGVSAAVTAARLGKKVRLFEAQGSLGGIWTSGLLSCIIDFVRGTLTKEIIARLDARHARKPRHQSLNDRNFIYEPEAMKVVLEDLCTEAGVEFIYHAPVVAVEKDAAGRRIASVLTESKSGRQAWCAPVFIDCTGDGDLAARAGCGFDTGGEKSGEPDQPASLMALVLVDDGRTLAPFVASKKAFYEALVSCGVEPSYALPTLFPLTDRLFALMANHEYGVPLDDAEAITRATVRARKELWTMVTALVERGGSAWKGLRLVATAEQLGHRGARRIHGRYTITLNDVLEGRHFADEVACCEFGIDLHAVSRAANRVLAAGVPDGLEAKPFGIPFRACQAKDLDNLYMAGRCISGDFLPQAAYRVTGPAVEMAEGLVKRILAARAERI